MPSPRVHVSAPRARRRWAVRSFSLVAALAGLLGATTDVSAEWPPSEGATPEDLRLPENWPNDGNYGPSDDNDGQWNFFSFIPDAAPNVERRAGETASGMSVDLAWRHTIGDPRVRIVVTDSGMNWDKTDLIDQAWINYRELGNHRPKHADGTACADLDPEFHSKHGGGPEDPALLKGFDCNGDGILTASDYAETPDLEPAATESHPQGDKNANGFFDPGDLILAYSDGDDDDGNGYVDDICGWDFMKHDNDPYDDTRFGHGTAEANDAVARTNNLEGDAGVCPLCRFVPMRVSDSYIGDAQAFAQALVYTTDNDATIVLCALGNIDQSNSVRSALDYAYANGVLVITSMGDESSKHHNIPATANHTLPVHAIQFDGTSPKTSTTFFAYHPCSNYGGHNFLSAPGTRCSSEATGVLSGVAGLVYSAALEYGVDLTPNEAMQLFFANTDDIDVPESHEPESRFKWSQPGFDQRFGYGRVNANRTIESLKAKRIPPEVDITEPQWYSVLYKNKATAPIDIVGTVSAKRANSFDYVVEWAPGVQPLDDEFQRLAGDTNIDSAITVGHDGAIASLDLSKIDPAHERDTDSLLGENDATITVRIRSTAHYGGAIGDVNGEMRRTYYVLDDPTVVEGFPIYLGDSAEASPKMADLDGDGARELVLPTGGGLVHAYKVVPGGVKELPGFPFRANTVDGLADPPPNPSVPVYTSAPAYANQKVDVKEYAEGFVSSTAIADVDGDGKLEIVASSFAGTTYVIGSDGKSKPGWPKRMPDVPSCPLDPTVRAPVPCMNEQNRIARGAASSPVLEDLDKDGSLEIIQSGFDGNVHVWRADGAPQKGFPVRIHYTGPLSEEPALNRIGTTPAVGDFNGDGIPDLLVGSNELLGEGGQSGAIYLVDGRGNEAPGGPILPGWPITMTSFHLFPLVAEGIPNAGAIATVEGVRAAIMHGNATPPLILPAKTGGQTKLNEIPPAALPQRDDPDNPGRVRRGVDPSATFGPLSKAEQPNTMLPLFAQPSAGDIDQDGVPDIIASGGSLNMAINLQSKSDTGLKGDHLLAVWSGKTGKMLPASPFLLEDFTFFNNQAIADLNGDDYPEIITGSGGFMVHAIDGCGREPNGFPKSTGQWIVGTAAVGDLDGDGTLELAVGTRSGWLYAWHTEGTTDSIIEWEGYHHDNRNTGNLDTPLEQGGKRKAKSPLTEATCTAVDAPTDAPPLAAGGGCGLCGAAANGSPTSRLPFEFVFGSLLVATAAVRRRQSRRSVRPLPYE